MRPVVVVLPGMDGAARLLGCFAEAMQPFADVQLIDLPDDRALGYDELTDAMQGQLPEGRPFFLLGYSFSGPIAIRLAAEQPNGLVGLILCCTFACTPRPLLTQFATWIPLSLVPSRLQATLLFGLHGDSTIRGAFKQVMTQLNTKVLGHRIAAVSTVDELAKLGCIQAPTLYLRAKGDQLVPVSAGRLIFEKSSNCTLKAIPGPHALLHIRPDEAAREIVLFIKQRMDGLSASQPV
ncbi:MAG: alpha/beta hydrolase [Rhodanobacteraceae bacterium]|nr:alpha/beta hydrolase [Rhodanobacteraceae bacterium]